MKINAGLDVGNGYVKGLIKGKGDVERIDLPSGVSIQTGPNALPTEDELAVGVVLAHPSATVSDFYNDLDVSFTSPVVGDSFRHLFGTRALNARGAFDEFNVKGRLSKAQQELSKVLILGCFAAKALKDYVESNGGLPKKELSVEARVCVALPIDEYMKYRMAYKASLENGVHVVTIHNFSTPVTVRVVFDEVMIMAEGASAQWAIIEKGEPLMNSMLADVRSRGLALEGITAADILAAKNTIGVDVGEGTVNFPVFTNGRFNPDASVTFQEGYGSALTRALEAMDAADFNTGFTSRKQLADFLIQEPSPLRRSFYERVKTYVDTEVMYFCKSITERFGRVLADVGASSEVVFVFGGGSGAIKDVLYPMLMAKAVEMNSEDAFPILYLDASYSRLLNAEGLYSLVSRKKKD